MAISRTLVDAVLDLEPQPRGYRWTSVTYCLLDAVWSIGINYDRHVIQIVRRVAAKVLDAEPVITATSPLPPEPLPLTKFITLFPTSDSLVELTSRHRTSSTNGILKGDAALRYAQALTQHGVDSLADARAVLEDPDRVDAISVVLRRIPGDGVRTEYFWMLVGDDEMVKPDRMILRFLARHGHMVNGPEAKVLLREVAIELSTPDRPVTPWMVDHAIWRAERRER
ncbi:hypothetical protein [Oerskovia jenensis]|uniref:hypothetical protein n=1 Tax=Oerskovia jenensis TaxID=162169 RepID=UPI0036D817A5